jgi:predicted RNA-binding Zn ribbon-like protein
MTKASRGRPGRVARPAPAPSEAEPLPGQLELVRPPAPGQLELVRDFLNTLDSDRGTDALATPAGLAAWLQRHDVLPPSSPFEATDDDAARARRIREDLRALARRNNGVACACSMEGLEDASARSGFALAFDPEGASARLRPTAAGLDGALGRILAAVHAAMLAGTWSRLKACADDGCAWAYYDRSKNGCSRWCDDTCLNRSKVKRFRERRSVGPTPAPG